MESKKPWLSKTIIINAIVGVALGLSPFIPSLAAVGEFFKNNAVLIGTAWSILNIALRTITKGKISLED